MTSSAKLHYIVHVQPSNLRATETADNASDPLGFPPLPVWVVRPECARERSALVFGWTVVNGNVRSHTTPLEPLPDTDGHGWAYIECDTLMVQTKPSGPDAWQDAAYLFTGVCSPIASQPFTPMVQPSSDDDMSRDGSGYF